MKFTEEITEAIAKESGVMAITMRELRDGFGYKRLGPHVVATISAELKAVGLGHFPVPLPDDQRENVLIYKLNSPLEGVLKAVVTPSPESVEVLRQLYTDENHAATLLAQIKQLVAA